MTLIRAEHPSDTEHYNVILGTCGNASKMTLHWTNLRKYTAYRITVAGVTDRGFGKASDEVTVLTDEEGKNIITKCVVGFILYVKTFSVEKPEKIVIDNSVHYKTTIVVHNKSLFFLFCESIVNIHVASLSLTIIHNVREPASCHYLIKTFIFARIAVTK